MNAEPKNIEMYYLLSICLMIIAIVGVFHTPVFEVFEVRATQTVLYALTGMSLVGFSEYFRKDLSLFTKVLAGFYGIISLMGVLVAFYPFPLLSQFSLAGANNFLHAFIAAILFYLASSKEQTVQI